jgi:hypothetical protein
MSGFKIFENGSNNSKFMNKEVKRRLNLNNAYCSSVQNNLIFDLLSIINIKIKI